MLFSLYSYACSKHPYIIDKQNKTLYLCEGWHTITCPVSQNVYQYIPETFIIDMSISLHRMTMNTLCGSDYMCGRICFVLCLSSSWLQKCNLVVMMCLSLVLQKRKLLTPFWHPKVLTSLQTTSWTPCDSRQVFTTSVCTLSTVLWDLRILANRSSKESLKSQ